MSAAFRLAHHAGCIRSPLPATAQLWELVRDAVPSVRRTLHGGDAVFRAGQPFTHLHMLRAGSVKVVKPGEDGHEHVVSFRFGGDWLGLDGIATGTHPCDALAMDVGEAVAVPYDALRAAAARCDETCALLLAVTSAEIGRERDAWLEVASLPADARVARFLQRWADHLWCSGLRRDQFTLHMTRTDIGNHLGLRIESVSRAMRRLEDEHVIRLSGADRRDLTIDDPVALAECSLGHAER